MKRTCIIGLSLLAAMAGKAQQKALLTGSIKGYKDSTLVFYYKTASGEHKDTVAVKHGNFTWQGNVPEPTRVLLFSKAGYAEFYAENSRMKLTGSADSFNAVHVTGSALQAESDAFDALIKPIEEEETPLYPEYSKVKGDDSATARIDDKLDELRAKRRAITAEYMRTHRIAGSACQW